MSRARGVLDGPPDSGLPADDALLTGLPLVGDKKSITACKFQGDQCINGLLLFHKACSFVVSGSLPLLYSPTLTPGEMGNAPRAVLVIQRGGNRLPPAVGMARKGALNVGVLCLAAAFGGARAVKGKDFSASKALMPSFAMCFESGSALPSPRRSLSPSAGPWRRLRMAPHSGAPLRGNSFSTSCMAASSASSTGAVPVGKGPDVKEEIVEYKYHGYTRQDPYAWMKDDDWQKVLRDPSILRQDIRAHLEKENSHVDAVMEPTKELQAKLVEEMKGRMAQDDSSVPMPDGPYAYFSRYTEGGEYPIRSRISRSDLESGAWSADGSAPASQEDLVDGNVLGAGQEFFKLGAIEHSPDHKIVAYSVDLKGSEYFTVMFKDIATGEMVKDQLVNCSSSFVWCKDSKTVVYAVIDDNHRTKWVYRHKLGDPQSKDELLYTEPDDGFFLGVSITDTGNWIVIDASDHDTSEARLVSASGDAGSKPLLVQERQVGVKYDVSDFEDQLIILTNEGGATDFKVVTAPISSPGKASWRDLVPHKPGVLIRGVQTVKGHLIRSERVSALPRLQVSSCSVKDGKLTLSDEHSIQFNEESYGLRAHGNLEHDTTNLRISFSSPCTPESVFDYDIIKRTKEVRKVQKVPSGHNADDYVCKRLQVPAHDGVMIPITVLHRKDTPIDGSSPCLLYGYGSYGISMPAEFSTNRLSMVDRGVVYVIAHVRGGTDCGYGWYDPDGKMMKKKNSFLDFISAAEYLVKEKYTSEGKIAIQGGSAGGMLVGAAMNMAREGLLQAVIGEVPFVDVLNTMCDTTLPLTPPEWPEWGNPIESKEAYDYMESYSPYDQVTTRKYPHLLATGGLTDPRVTYWEPAKWVAKVRKLRSDDGLSLCKINMGAGHAGKSGRFDRLEEVALVYAFMLMVFGKL